MNRAEAEVVKEVFKDGPYPGSSLLTISNFARPGIVVEIRGLPSSTARLEIERPRNEAAAVRSERQTKAGGPPPST